MGSTNRYLTANAGTVVVKVADKSLVNTLLPMVPSLCRSVMLQPLGNDGQSSMSWNNPPRSSSVDLPSLSVRANSISSGRVCRERQLLLMLAAILASFGVCYLPLLVAAGLGVETRSPPWLALVARFLFSAAPCVNPLVYVVMSRDYRRAYVALVCGVEQRRPSDSDANHYGF